MQWEPGFDGGFRQQFRTRVKEVKSGKELLPNNYNHSKLEPDMAFVTQNVVLEPNVEYAFSVEAVNVQGSSGYTEEKRKSLTGNSEAKYLYFNCNKSNCLKITKITSKGWITQKVSRSRLTFHS